MSKNKDIEPKNRLVVFQNRQIRRIWHEDKWHYSVVDICGVLTDSADSGAYWRKLKQRLKQEGSEVVTICHGLKIEAPDVIAQYIGALKGSRLNSLFGIYP
jgi:hypothetical protein